VTTAVLSLDATVVLLTPVVFATAARLEARARPHVYACTHLANSASLLLPVSNLTNLLAFAASGLAFGRFAALMAVPWLAAIGVEYAVFGGFFRSDLSAGGRTDPGQGTRLPRVTLVVVALTLAGFVAASAAGINPAWAAFAGAAVLAVRALARRTVAPAALVRAADPPCRTGRTGRGGGLGAGGPAHPGPGRRPGAARPEEPGQGHPVRRRSRRLPGSAGMAGVPARGRHHSPAATSPTPAGSLIGHFVDQARKTGASWTDIGQSMGVTKQAAQKRFVPRASDWPGLLSGAFPPDPVKFSRFTDRAKRAVIAARQEAIKRRHDRVLPEHLILGMLHEQEGLAARAIAALGVSPEAVRAAEESLGGGTLAGLGITKERALEWLVPVLEQMAAAKRPGG